MIVEIVKVLPLDINFWIIKEILTNDYLVKDEIIRINIKRYFNCWTKTSYGEKHIVCRVNS